jgi:hypothetical protein
MGTETLRQECAKYILAHPGASVTNIIDSIGEVKRRPEGKAIYKLLKRMLDEGEVTRTGTLKMYRYYPGERIENAVKGERSLLLPPKRRTGGRRVSNVMQIRQTWVRAGDYTIKVGDTRFNSLWSYADSLQQA